MISKIVGESFEIYCRADQRFNVCIFKWEEENSENCILVNEQPPWNCPGCTVYILGQFALCACCLFCSTGLNWFVDSFGRANSTIFAQISKEGIECTKIKE